MISARDLRIGNYVWEDYGGNYIIQAISSDYVFLSKYPDSLQGKYDVKQIKPLPLTEEELLKFGFSFENEDRLDWVKGAFNLEKNREGKFFFEVYSHYIPVDWVHQFQNLYYLLTNKELTYIK